MNVRRMLSVIAGAAALLSEAVAAPAPLCEQEMLRASRRYAIPVNVLYAVSLTEAGRGGQVEPFAINVEGKPLFAPNLQQAIEHVQRAQRAGARLIDIGCMQINHHFHGRNFSSVADMFHPARNVDYGARFLLDLKRREGTWTKAVARYHAGPGNPGAQKTYVCLVIRNMVRAGLGEWTAQARSFCDAQAALTKH